MKTLKEYIASCMHNGKHFFTKDEAASELNLNQSQFQMQVWRLYQKKLVKNLGHGFFMIIIPEYYHYGSLPPQTIIDPLMRHLGIEYYIGLLSAASLYGATDQQPMVFQVITSVQIKPITLERGLIEFHYSKSCKNGLIEQLTVPTGYVKISTKEQTMIDLVRYQSACGWLNNVASILKDLAAECTAQKLMKAIERESTETVLQRLGYILEYTGHNDLAKAIELELAKRSIRFTYLRPDSQQKEGMRHNRWKLLINEPLEVEP